MYIKETRGWYEGTAQHTGRQWFLLLVQPGEKFKSVTSDYEYYIATRNDDGEYPRPRAIVRKVALSQLGQFMMGFAHAFGHRITCSGAYGNMGLTRTVAQEVYDKAVDLPENLYKVWAKDTTGWNDAGKTGVYLRNWAIAHFSELAPAGTTY